MKAVLLDREGTIIVDPPFDRVDSPEKIQLLPATLLALKLLAEQDYGVIVITNQTNIAQGRVTEEGFWDLHNQVIDLLKPTGITVLKTYVCPHNSNEGCECRKPNPLLLARAIEEFNLVANETFMVGDRDSDVRAAVNAGVRPILVKTGKFPTFSEDAEYIADDLLSASQYIVSC